MRPSIPARKRCAFLKPGSSHEPSVRGSCGLRRTGCRRAKRPPPLAEEAAIRAVDLGNATEELLVTLDGRDTLPRPFARVASIIDGGPSGGGGSSCIVLAAPARGSATGE